MALAGVQSWGYPAYLAATVAATVPLAVASWWLVEKHALRLKKVDARALARRIVTPAGAAPVDRAPVPAEGADP
jgi:peptidoglycan/LPS O-acetylase OafA/YrhL